MFGGVGVQGSLNDLCEFNPATGQWARMAGNSTVADSPIAGAGQPGVYGTLGTPSASNKPGSRTSAVGWKDKVGGRWLFGGWGLDANGDVGNLNDLWRFDLSTNQWTWMGGNSTLPCLNTAADQCGDQPSVYGVFGTPAAGNNPGGRSESTGWTDGNGNFWLYGASAGMSETTSATSTIFVNSIPHSMSGHGGEATGRSHRAECTSRKKTGGCARWGLRRWRTRSSNRL